MKVVVCLSGGMDSAVLAWDAVKQGMAVRCLSVDYGQRHRRELIAASELARCLGVEHRVVDLTSLLPFLQGSSQTTEGVKVPEGHYTEPSMKATVVPNRNMLILGVATAWAVSEKCHLVGYAAHAGDHTIYPDCRPEYVEALGKAIGLCDWHQVGLITPYLGMTKGEIVERGHRIGVPFEMTYSCYQGWKEHCGVCGTCTERKEAFHQAGVRDPTEYLR